MKYLFHTRRALLHAVKLTTWSLQLYFLPKEGALRILCPLKMHLLRRV
jgi:hypothetical protein